VDAGTRGESAIVVAFVSPTINLLITFKGRKLTSNVMMLVYPFQYI
jgi:hypothetical protein